MKYLEIIAEAIPTRPTYLKGYLQTRIKDLDRLLADLTRAGDLLKQGAREGDDLIRQAMRYGTDDEDLKMAAYPAYLEDFRVDDYYRITDLRHSLDSYLQHGPNFLSYIVNTLENVRPAYEQVREQIALLPTVEKGLEIYGYEPGNSENDSDEQYVAGQQYLEGLRLKARVITSAEAVEANIKSKIDAIVDLRNFGHTGRDSYYYRPKHEEVETLYHATTHLTEILRDGFLAEKPDDRHGVGNLGRQAEISFTHDLGIAQNIMRTFKEIWMIAHRQLTGREIERWFAAEGLDIQKLWSGQEGRRPLPVGPDSDPVKVAMLYRIWQWNTKLRQNAVLINIGDLVHSMASRKLSDIGVLSAEVRVQDSQYLWAEAEFRVNPDQVLSVRKVF